VTSTRGATYQGDRIQVANMSLTGSGSATTSGPDCKNTNNDALHEAICRSVSAGVTYVVAAGNDGIDSVSVVPAAYDEVITVSALGDTDGKPGSLGPNTSYGSKDDSFVSWSNFGGKVDIAGPGVDISSTYMNAGYAVMSGTSMASPHVAGAAALYLKTYPGTTPAQVRTALRAAGKCPTAGRIPDGYQGDNFTCADPWLDQGEGSAPSSRRREPLVHAESL